MSRNRKFPRYVKLELERLEEREAPSVTPWTTLSFDGIPASPPGSPPSMPLNSSQWNSDNPTNSTDGTYFSVSSGSATPALSGSNSFSVMSGSNGLGNDVSRAWLDQTMPADVQVSAAVYVNSLIPAQVIARGSNLDLPDNQQNGGPSFYGLELSVNDPGPLLAIVKDVNGNYTTTPLASIKAPDWVEGAYLVETLDVEGTTIRAQLFDPSTDEYLNSGGSWQVGQAWALTVIDNSITGPGLVGLGRPSSYTGTVTFDDFSVQTPATVQSFDATPVGSLPDNWSSYSSNTSDSVSVADPSDPAPPSGTNALAITAAESGDVDRAWLDTSLTGNLSVSASTYLDTLTPAQVFADGTGLNTTSPSYYAVQVTRGYLTASLVKVVNGTPTPLLTVDSTDYVPDVWVQETLAINGTTLEAEIYRTDTDQYLTSIGGWQSTPTWALTATDSTLDGGATGVGRPVVPEYAETNYFDDFTTVTGTSSEDFDTTPNPPAGSLPTGWAQWSTDQGFNSTYFSMSNKGPSGPFLSASNVLESTGGGSTVSAAAWLNYVNDEYTNAEVSAGLYMTTLMPTLQVIARGTYLFTSTPNYYGLSVTAGENGLTVNLVRVQNGTSTTLAELGPASTYTGVYFSGQWIEETLYVDGSSIRAQIYRTDTGEYLNSEDLWQTTPTYALDVTDTSPLNGAGFAGFVRPSGYSNLNPYYFDNFSITPLSTANTPPSVSVSAPSGTLRAL